MLLNLKTAFDRKEKCIVAFNFYNIESLMAILNAAKEAEKPVIAAFGESYLSHMPLEAVAAVVREYDRIYNIPLVLHLDHAKEKSVIHKAISLGFTSVMYDGSRLPIEQNIQNTKEIVEFAQKYQVSVEGELGCMNSEDGTRDNSGTNESFYTSPSQAKRFSSETHVDALAVSVGNAHGIYRGAPHIDLERVKQIRQASQIPLVLHGCSGIPRNVLIEAAQYGIKKINVNTDLSLGAANAARHCFDAQSGNIKMEIILKQAQDAMEEIAKGYLNLFS